MGRFYLLAAVDNVAMNMGIRVSVPLSLIFFDIYLGGELLGHMVILPFIF